MSSGLPHLRRSVIQSELSYRSYLCTWRQPLLPVPPAPPRLDRTNNLKNRYLFFSWAVFKWWNLSSTDFPSRRQVSRIQLLSSLNESQPLFCNFSPSLRSNQSPDSQGHRSDLSGAPPPPPRGTTQKTLSWFTGPHASVGQSRPVLDESVTSRFFSVCVAAVIGWRAAACFFIIIIISASVTASQAVTLNAAVAVRWYFHLNVLLWVKAAQMC